MRPFSPIELLRRVGLLAVLLSATPATAQKSILILNPSADVATLDPHLTLVHDGFSVMYNLYDTVLTRDTSARIAPSVASTWHFTSPTELELTLRSDIRFQDGMALTAADVAYSINRMIDPALASSQASAFAPIKSVAVLAPDRIRLTTVQPYPLLLAALARLAVVPEQAFRAMSNDEIGTKPAGSGPYRLVRRQRGVMVQLERNEAYWGTKGSFTQVELRPVPDVSTRVANLRSGRADIVDRLLPDTADELAADKRFEVRGVATERVGYLRLNAARAPFDDVRVRQAVALAVDRQTLNTTLLSPFARQIDSMLTPVHFGYSEAERWPAYDPAQAKRLVAEVGTAAKQRIDFATSPNFDQRIVQAVQQMLNDVGLNVAIEMTDQATFVGRIRGEPTRQATLYYGQWNCACLDADGVLWSLLHSASTWSATRIPELDRLLDAGRNSVDETARLAAYQPVHQLIRETVPMVPLHQVAYLAGVDRRIIWQPMPNEALFLNRIGWKE